MSGKKIIKSIVGLLLIASLVFLSIKNNIRSFYVLTGSMEPLIPAGSLIISGKTSDLTVRTGKVVVYNDKDNRRITAHRVVDVWEGRYVTKGDANDFNDRYLVRPEDVVGEVLVVIPVANPVTVILQLVFLLLAIVVGVLLRRFLLFLFKYGISCPSATYNPVRGICPFGSAKKTVFSGKKDPGSG